MSLFVCIVALVAGLAVAVGAAIKAFGEIKSSKDKGTDKKDTAVKVIALVLVLVSGACNITNSIITLVNDTAVLKTSPIWSFKYEQSGNGIVITGYKGNDSHIVIPPVINKRVVSEVGAGAFQGNQKIESVEFRSGVTKISPSAFKGCSNLKVVTLPSTLKSLGASAFEDCLRLERIDFLDGIKVISANTFSGCSSMNPINLPTSLEYINDSAFQKCDSLVTVVLPKNIQDVHHQAFLNCENLRVIFTDNDQIRLIDFGPNILVLGTADDREGVLQ